MQIVLGKTAGFCFGVRNAVEKTEDELEKTNHVYCLGELVHNSRVTGDLEKRGAIFIDNIEDAKGKVIIRAHGEPLETYEKAKELGLEIVDLTCPKVLKIHDIANEYSNKGYYIILTGEETHPEVKGTIGFCNKCYIIKEENDIEGCIREFEESGLEKAILISQTTFKLEKFEYLSKILKEKLGDKLEIHQTICSATKLRQEETEKLSKQVDLMIIIGGKNSSNSTKLYEIAKKNCNNTFFVDSVEDLNIEEIKGFKSAGIMAGASTPQISIEEVIDKLKAL